MKARLLLVLSFGLLAGCGSDGMDDLRHFVATAHADKKPKVEPMPEVKTYKSVEYAAADLADPFAAANLQPQKAAGAAGPHPDMNRRKEPLEEYPLDALKMVGTLARGHETWAIIRAPDGSVHRVARGDHLGQNFGKVVRIGEEKVDVVEIIAGPLGNWLEREAAIAIQE